MDSDERRHQKIRGSAREGGGDERPPLFDPMLDPLHEGGGAHARRRDMSRLLPWYIGLFVLAPLLQYLLLKAAGH